MWLAAVSTPVDAGWGPRDWQPGSTPAPAAVQQTDSSSTIATAARTASWSTRSKWRLLPIWAARSASVLTRTCGASGRGGEHRASHWGSPPRPPRALQRQAQRAGPTPLQALSSPVQSLQPSAVRLMQQPAACTGAPPPSLPQPLPRRSKAGLAHSTNKQPPTSVYRCASAFSRRRRSFSSCSAASRARTCAEMSCSVTCGDGGECVCA